MSSPEPRAFELPLPWGPVVRGRRWDGGPDRVLLLHEPGADLDAWGPLPDQLARELNVAVVAVDFPGHGLSDDPWEPQRTGELIRFLWRDLGGRLASPQPTLTPLPPSPGAQADRGRYCRFPASSGVRLPSPTAVGEGSGVRASGRPHDTSPCPCAQGEGEAWRQVRQFLIVAKAICPVALDLAVEEDLAGLVCLSPEKPDWSSPKNPPATPPVPCARGDRVRPKTPKLFFAGSLAGNDLSIARRLAAASGGWAVVTSIPVADRGTGLLETSWRARITEEIVGFLRDCRRHPPTGIRRRTPARKPILG